MTLKSDLRRLWHIVTVLITHVVRYKAEQHRSKWPWLDRYLPQDSVPKPERVRMVFEELGGTFIKLGQMLALQPDILPLEYCNALFKLLDRINPFAFEEVERTFHEQFSQSPSEIFDHFDPEPIATASIGQVYVAYLGTRKLAVKVRRPSAEADFTGDVRLMMFTLWVIQILRLKQLYWMIEPLSEFTSWTREELDFRFETRYMEELRRNAQDNAVEYIPEVVKQYSTHCILTLEFLEGDTLLKYIQALEAGDELNVKRIQATGFDPDQFARHIIDNFLNDAFQYGMFHADLHPANLMILRNNVVGYIDFGITGVISPYLRHNIVALTLAYSRGDLDGMYDAFFRISALAPDADLEAFRHGLQKLSNDWYTLQDGEYQMLKNITLVMLDLLKLSRETGVWPERDVIKYIRSAVAIDGLITRFAPSFNVGKYLEYVCDQYLKWHVRQQLFTFDTLASWSTANQNLLQNGMVRAATWLNALTLGEPPVPPSAYSLPDTREILPQRAVQLASIVFVAALLMSVTDMPIQFGVNLFTAGLLLVAFATSSLIRTLVRLI